MALVNYQQVGSGDHILLIHGLLGSLENLNMVAKTLKEHFTVTSIDVRNHGSSFHENDMDYATMAKDVIDLLDSLAIEKTHILGHSMGGKIAMQTALSYPERLNKLLVADIAPVQYPAHHQQILAGLKAINLESLSNRKAADEQLAPYVELASTRQFLLRNLSAVDGKYSFKCNLDNISACYPQIMKGQHSNTPCSAQTLFIKGGASDYITLEHKDVINELFPNSQAKVIQGAGHWLHAEKTNLFNNIVLKFLNA